MGGESATARPRVAGATAGRVWGKAGSAGLSPQPSRNGSRQAGSSANGELGDDGPGDRVPTAGAPAALRMRWVGSEVGHGRSVRPAACSAVAVRCQSLADRPGTQKRRRAERDASVIGTAGGLVRRARPGGRLERHHGQPAAERERPATTSSRTGTSTTPSPPASAARRRDGQRDRLGVERARRRRGEGRQVERIRGRLAACVLRHRPLRTRRVRLKPPARRRGRRPAGRGQDGTASCEATSLLLENRRWTREEAPRGMRGASGRVLVGRVRGVRAGLHPGDGEAAAERQRAGEDQQGDREVDADVVAVAGRDRLLLGLRQRASGSRATSAGPGGAPWWPCRRSCRRRPRTRRGRPEPRRPCRASGRCSRACPAAAGPGWWCRVPTGSAGPADATGAPMQRAASEASASRWRILRWVFLRCVISPPRGAEWIGCERRGGGTPR